MADGVEESEVGFDRQKEGEMAHETYEGATQERSWDANVKRTYDEYQDVALTAARRSQVNYDSLQQYLAGKVAELDKVSLQALQNAVETANMTGKQAVRHSDLAIDRQWNLDEVSHIAGGSVTSIAAIAAAVAAAVVETLGQRKT